MRAKRVIIRVINFCKRVKWRFGSLFLRLRGHYDKGGYQIFQKSVGNTLIIVPHADDEIVGCFHYITRFKDRVQLLYCQFLGDNYTDEMQKIRLLEFERFCKSIDLPFTISTPQNVVRDIKKLLVMQDITQIFSPSVVDWHPEHRLCSKLLSIALNDSSYLGEIYWYHVTIPIPFFAITHTIPVSKKGQEDKWNVFYKFYASQRNLNVDRFKYYEHANVNGTYAYESYLRLPNTLCLEFDELFITEIEADRSFKTSLSNYLLTYKKASEYYLKILERWRHLQYL
ncbi:PIG-L deacetylase family protein [Porphyromonas levii]|uniref:PIG-L deacetylase family protein n=1 Tax=Porphyromonas levii TaxID=28114 RepID=UPI001BA86424|nr:hypothetical protein [Porphyromonas levii]MBR8806250.1 hypothetical protein [Porphyromonas levii]